MKKTISVLVEKDPGGLARIISLLTRRRYQIESLTIGQCERNGYERMTIVLSEKGYGEDNAFQLTRQLQKLITVMNVKDITNFPSIHRELLLMKLQVTTIERAEVLNLSQIFKLKIIDVTDSIIILEAAADPTKIKALQNVLKKYKILELVKTGEIALTTHSLVNTSTLNLGQTEGTLSSNYLENIESSLYEDYYTPVIDK